MGASPGPSCSVCPSFSQPDAIGVGPRVHETPASEDAAGQEERRV
jgi:hypothetical protein